MWGRGGGSRGRGELTVEERYYWEMITFHLIFSLNLFKYSLSTNIFIYI